MTMTLVKSKGEFFCRNILDECIKGNFEKTLDYVNNTSLEGKITSQIAIQILASCSNACFFRKEDISAEYLFKILRIIQPSLRNLNENDFLKYMKSMHNFIHFMVYKNSLELVIQMEPMLIPDFQPEAIQKNCKEKYHSIAVILYNLIAKVSRGSEFCPNTHFKISMLLVQLSKFLEAKTAMKLVFDCFKNLIYMKIELQYQIRYYKAILSALDFSKVGPKCEEVFKQIQYFSWSIITSVITTEDFETGKEFLNDSCKQIKTVLNHEEYIHLHSVLRFFLITKLSKKGPEIDKSIESLLKLKKILEKTSCRKDVAHNLLSLLDKIRNYFIAHQEEWLNFSEELQLQIIRFIKELHSFQIVDANNNDLKSINNDLAYSHIISSLTKIYMSRISNDRLEYHEKYIQIMEYFFKYTESLKRNNFEHWKKFWNNLASYMYNTGYGLHQKSNDAASLYFLLILKYFFKLEDINAPYVINYSTLQFICTMLKDIYSKECKRTLSFLSLAGFLCREDKGVYLSQWVKLKYAHKDNEEVQKTNSVTALLSLQQDFPDWKIGKAEKLYLLQSELEYYKKTKWMSAIPIASALKGLVNFVDIESAATIIVKVFIDIDLPNHDEVYKIVANVLKNYKSCAKTAEMKVNLAVLHYIYYKNNHKKRVSKNAIDMENTMSVVPLKTQDNLEPSEACDETNITSSYECLKLDMYTENLKNLEYSLAIFHSTLPKIKKDLDNVTLSQLYNLLLDISFHFKLSHFKKKVVEALELALQIAQLLNDVPRIVKTAGFIIEQIGINQVQAQNLEAMADKLIEDKEFNINNLESVLYYMCKSKALLYDSYKQSYDFFKKAEKLLELVEEKNGLGIVRSQLLLLSSKFAMLPCSLGVGTHGRSLLVDAFLSLEMVIEETKSAKMEDPYKISVLFEVSEEFIKIYHYLKCPREVRIYAKEIVFLTQKLVLPIACATLLTYLAHADLIGDHRDECLVKIKDLDSILNLSKSNQSGKMYMKLNSPSSPNLGVSGFQMPSIAQHKNTCECYYCNSLGYQALVLEKIRLNALINVKEQNNVVADDFFKGALKLYDRYSKEQKDFVPEFLTAYGYILLNYSGHMWRTDDKVEALRLNKKLEDFVKDKKFQNVHLYHEILLQKLGFLTENIIPQPEPDLQTAVNNLQISKTPENKQSQVTVLADTSSFSPMQKLKVKKILPLCFSPTETDTLKVPAKTLEKTQSPKIRIYTDGPTKTRRPRVPSNDPEKFTTPKIQIRPPTDKITTRKKTTNVLKETYQYDFSPAGVDKVLKTRSRLLTDKLKKNMEYATSDIENQAQNEPKTNSRKNLLKELADSENDPKAVGKGAIRKSSRTKK